MRKYRPPTKEEIIRSNLLSIKDWQITCKGSPVQDLYWAGVPRTERRSISRAEIARQRAEAIKADAAERAAAAAAKAKAEAEAAAEAAVEAASERLLRRSKNSVSRAEMLELTEFLEEPIKSAIRENWGKEPKASYVICRLGWRIIKYTFSENVYVEKEVDDAFVGASITLCVGESKLPGWLGRVLLRSKPIQEKAPSGAFLLSFQLPPNTRNKAKN